MDVAVPDVKTTIENLEAGTTYYPIVAVTSLYSFALGPSSEVVAATGTRSPACSAPVITAINALPSPVAPGDPVLFAATASNTDGDELSHTWSIDGSIVARPTEDLSQHTWFAGVSGGHTVQVTVIDGTTTVNATTSVTVT